MTPSESRLNHENRTMIRACLVVLFIAVYILLAAPPMLLYTILARETDSIYAVGRFGARVSVWLSGAKLEVHGQEKIQPGQAALYLANHQSNIDPPALVSILPPVWIMAKKEFFNVPLLNIGMRMRGFIPIDRRNRTSAIQSIDRAVEALKSGRPFIAFPEGTRSPDGRVRRFKGGVFVMAIKSGVPVVPISVSGSRKVMAKGKFKMRPGTVRITFHDPLPTTGMAIEDRGRLRDAVRERILTGLSEEERQPPPQTAG